MYTMKSVEDLFDHIGYVVLCAPDRFPTEDYLLPEQQMNLQRAFEQLREGVAIAFPDDFYPEKRAPLYSMLDMAYAAYLVGDTAEGSRLLYDFQNGIFFKSD